MMYSILLWISLGFCIGSASAGGCREIPRNHIECIGIVDGDLPEAASSYNGYYERIVIYESNITTLEAESFPGISTRYFVLSSLQYLQVIKPDFLKGSEGNLKWLAINGNSILRYFPFEEISKFHSLEQFDLMGNDIQMIPPNISWPSTLKGISLNGNMIQGIGPNAFSSANNLETLELWTSVKNISSNGLHTTSKNATLVATGGPGDGLKLSENAFGNVDGGQLWKSVAFSSTEFPENVFRLLLKAHFDKGHQSFIVGGEVKLDSCDTCGIAWLYKDAKLFGTERYKSLIGQGNVVCPNGIGPVLESTDNNFNSLMESCPYTPMPWPGPNYCQDVTDPSIDTTPDPENCSCYYMCAGSTVHGHECCPPGLVFNPDLLLCDWPFNVPSCQ